MNSFLKVALGVVPILGVAACEPSTAYIGASFDSQQASFDSLDTRISAEPYSGSSDVDALGGTATYTGLARIEASAGTSEVFIGEVTINADFTADTISGGVVDIIGETTGATDDVITFADGTIVDATISGDLAGNLTLDTTTYILHGDFVGAFRDYASTADALTADGSGDLYDETASDIGGFTIDIVAEQ